MCDGSTYPPLRQNKSYEATIDKFQYKNDLILYFLFVHSNSILAQTQLSPRCLKVDGSGNPRPKVTWSKVNEVDVAGKGEIMELNKVTRHHEGVYQCTANNVTNVTLSTL